MEQKTQFSTQKVCIDLNNIIFSVIIAIRSSSSRHFEMIWPAGRASTCLFYGDESFTRYLMDTVGIGFLHPFYEGSCICVSCRK